MRESYSHHKDTSKDNYDDKNAFLSQIMMHINYIFSLTNYLLKCVLINPA